MHRIILIFLLCITAVSYSYGLERQVMITGANRGLGLALAKQFIQHGDNVILLHRTIPIPTLLSDLKATYPKQVKIEQLDLLKFNAVTAFAKKYQSGPPIDILINNAAIYSPREPADNSFQNLYKHPKALGESMHTNASSPMLLASGMLPNIVKGKDKLIVFLASAGSRFSVIDKKRSRMGMTYVMSKSALHKGIDQAASDLKSTNKCLSPETCSAEQQLVIVGIDPGWIDTDMGKGAKNFQPEPGTTEKAAAAIVNLINSGKINRSLSGKLVNTSGSILAW